MKEQVMQAKQNNKDGFKKIEENNEGGSSPGRSYSRAEACRMQTHCDRSPCLEAYKSS